MTGRVIYHGTPLTPRPALQAMAGRSFCVSFWRPDDAEVVEAISPDIMFRQRRVLGMAGSFEARRAVVRARGLVALLSVAGRAAVSTGPMVSHPRCAGRAVPAQRRAAQRLAFRSVEGRAALAHGRPAGSVPAAGGAIRPGLHRMGGRRGSGLRGVVSAHGRTGAPYRQPMACDAHDARRPRCEGISIPQRRRDLACAERSSI